MWGFYSFWTFNKATEVATLEKVRPREVCHYPRNEDSANMRFVLRKDGDTIFTNDIFWLLVTFYDYLDEDGTLRGGIVDNKKKPVSYPSHSPLTLRRSTITRSLISKRVKRSGRGRLRGRALKRHPNPEPCPMKKLLSLTGLLRLLVVCGSGLDHTGQGHRHPG